MVKRIARTDKLVYALVSVFFAPLQTFAVIYLLGAVGKTCVRVGTGMRSAAFIRRKVPHSACHAVLCLCFQRVVPCSLCAFGVSCWVPFVLSTCHAVSRLCFRRVMLCPVYVFDVSCCVLFMLSACPDVF